MNENMIGRRKFIKGAGLATLATAGGAAGFVSVTLNAAQEAVPNTSGTERPKLKAPPLATDCHQHIYDPRTFRPRCLVRSRTRRWRITACSRSGWGWGEM